MQQVLEDATALDLAAAWRLAYAVCGHAGAADAAAEAAVAAQVSWLGPPSSIELFTATFREAEPAANVAPPLSDGDPLVDAWWGLPVDQRAALWLSVADPRPSHVAAEILALAPGAVTSLADAAQDRVVPPPATEHCPSRRQLSDYAAYTSSPDVTAAIEAHLDGCQPCSDRLGMVERLSTLGDPDTGPVPGATDAGRQALDRCLKARPEAWYGDLIDDAPAERPDPVAPNPSPSQFLVLEDEEAEAEAAAAEATYALGRAPQPSLRPWPTGHGAADAEPKPSGSVAAAALAAFRHALDNDGTAVNGHGPLAVHPADVSSSPVAPRRRPRRAAVPVPVDPRPEVEPAVDEEAPAPDAPEQDAPAAVDGAAAAMTAQQARAAIAAAAAQISAAAGPESKRGRRPRSTRGGGAQRFKIGTTLSVTPAEPPSLPDDPLNVADEVSERGADDLDAGIDPGSDVAIAALPPPPAEPVAADASPAAPAGVDDSSDNDVADDGWEPDERAWVLFGVDHTPPEGTAAASGPNTVRPEPASPEAATLAPEAGALAASAADGPPAAEASRAPAHLRARRPSKATPRVLAAATGAVLAAGIIGAILVHPKGFPRYETVRVGGTTKSSLFPGGTDKPTPSTTSPLIVLPPALVTTTLPPLSTTTSTTKPRSTTTAPVIIPPPPAPPIRTAPSPTTPDTAPPPDPTTTTIPPTPTTPPPHRIGSTTVAPPVVCILPPFITTCP